MLKKADVLLIVILALFALSFNFLFSRVESGRPRGAVVAVAVGGKTLRTIPLAESGSHVHESGGGRNVFEIAGGHVKMTEANCPDGLCLRQKSVSKSGEAIVCLPHKLVLTVEGGEPAGVDAVAY